MQRPPVELLIEHHHIQQHDAVSSEASTQAQKRPGVVLRWKLGVGKYRVTPLWHDGNMSSIDLPELADLQDLAPRELASVLTDLDMVRRRVDAMIAETVGIAERSAAYAEDGHASVTGWVKAICNYSGGETKAVVQSA